MHIYYSVSTSRGPQAVTVTWIPYSPYTELSKNLIYALIKLHSGVKKNLKHGNDPPSFSYTKTCNKDYEIYNFCEKL